MVKAFVNGVFDVLHPGHLALLDHARRQADWLCVGIDGDERVRARKGPDRPLHSQEDRATMLRSLRCVSHVEIFHSDQELTQLVQRIQPHIMIVGSDYRNQRVIGSEYARNLEFYERVPGHSTTRILTLLSGGG